MIHVDYQTFSNQWSLLVAGADIAAYVHEASARNVCLGGARVEVSGVGTSTFALMADYDGRVAIPNLQAAPFTLSISKPGYATAQVGIREYPRDPSADIALTPVTRIVDRVWDGTFAPDQCDYSNLQGGKRSLFFTAAADGVLLINRVNMKVLDVGGFSVLREGQPVSQTCRAPTWGAFAVTRGAEYELQVRGFGCGTNPPYGGFYDGSFHVEFSRPE